MFTTLCAIMFGLAAAGAAAAAPSSATTHVRPLTPSAAALVAEASERSSIVRDQLHALALTDVVVYVSDSMNSSGDEPHASLMFVSQAAGLRYLLVQIDRWKRTPPDRIVSLAHELQHALEVAAAPHVKSSADLALLYRHIGWEGKSGRFESNGAVSASRRVRNELAGFSQ
jgi:hypothetical protein